MSVAEHIRGIALRSVAQGLPPAKAAGAREVTFVRENSAQIWDAIAALRNGEKRAKPGAVEYEDPDPFEPCEECDGTGMTGDDEICQDCSGSGDKNYHQENDRDDPDDDQTGDDDEDD